MKRFVTMKCPRCIQPIHRAADACPHCGFSIADADLRFGDEEVRLRCLSDTAGVLKSSDRELVGSAMDRFDRKFPQLFIAVYTGSLGEVSSIRQFGFWLLNRAVFEHPTADKANEAGVLLTIDPASKTAGFVYGYLLDPFLDESDTFECLLRAHSYWLEGRYADGITRALRHLERILCSRSRHARRDPEQFLNKMLPPTMRGDRVSRMREGHGQSKPQVEKQEVDS